MANKNNKRDGVTGLLIYHDGSFLQILEGPDASLLATRSRILANPIHKPVHSLPVKDVAQRLFQDWSIVLAWPREELGDSDVPIRTFEELNRDMPRIDEIDLTAGVFIRQFLSGHRDFLYGDCGKLVNWKGGRTKTS